MKVVTVKVLSPLYNIPVMIHTLVVWLCCAWLCCCGTGLFLYSHSYTHGFFDCHVIRTVQVTDLVFEGTKQEAVWTLGRMREEFSRCTLQLLLTSHVMCVVMYFCVKGWRSYIRLMFFGDVTQCHFILPSFWGKEVGTSCHHQSWCLVGNHHPWHCLSRSCETTQMCAFCILYLLMCGKQDPNRLTGVQKLV